MTDYIVKHYSRYSSANNHLIVEAYAIGQTGVLCDYQPWIKLAVDILTRELPLQNYSDGVNKELSLHYQSFYMEAMSLMMRLLIKNNIEVPATWKPMLEKMCTYVADCMGDYGEVVVFGDDDEGKILDLQGGMNHYQYVLGMFSIMLDKQYTKLKGLECENLRWLFSVDERNIAQEKPSYLPPLSACYREGGNTVLRSKNHKILIGIDHAALGFGSIAAHGHADALSFQLFLKGHPVFVDPGTYIYHCDLDNRNAFRKTENHNTVCINGKDQSEMLGAFLWGKKAECELIDYMEDDDRVVLKARHNGFQPVIHTRDFHFNKENELVIQDVFNADGDKEIHFVITQEANVEILSNAVYIQTNGNVIEIKFSGNDFIAQKTKNVYSPVYGVKTETTGIMIRFTGRELVSRISL